MASTVLTESMLNQLEDIKKEITSTRKALVCMLLLQGCILIYMFVDMYGEFYLGY